ncbi:DNA repair protein rad52 [Branchiostoma belcheri]|nr:DNA repair protein rad52 [Branchiostoma belcheri]
MSEDPMEQTALNNALTFATESFGSGGWSSRCIELKVDYVEEKDNLYSVGAHSIVQVELQDGRTHSGIGWGSATNMPSKAGAYQQAIKRASTDGLCMALGGFGFCQPPST